LSNFPCQRREGVDGVDTKHLVTFITFTEEKSLNKASQKLNYAVSTVAEHIGILEAELGFTLVERKGRQVSITKNGENFLYYARKMMNVYKDTCSAMSYFAGAQGLRIITTESVALYTMPPIYAKFSKQYPEVDISVIIGNPNTFSDIIRKNEADIAFNFDWESVADDGLQYTPIYKEPVVFIAHPTHRLVRKKAVCSEDFRNETFIFPQKDSLYRIALNKVLREKNVSIQSRLYMDSGSMIKKCVQMGYGLSLMPYSVVEDLLERGELVKLNWAEEPFIATAHAITLKKEWTLPAIRELVHLSVTTLQSRSA
jgi:DNA-binding transcriptional LysR family regulator